MSPYEHYIMAVFWQLGKDRHYDSMSGMPRSITLQTFVYYQQLFDDVLNTDEVELLQHLDATYTNAIVDIRKEQNG